MSLYSHGGKRALDICLSSLAILVLAPLLALTAVLILMEDGRPVVFRQPRVGRYCKKFVILKFRSMPVRAPNVPSDQARNIKVTRVGAVIRRTNIDELPQLLNILRGDMSIVGPRPALPAQEELIAARSAAGALECRPGLTGLAQVSSFDGMSVQAKATLDARYAERITLFGDLVLIGRTVGYLFRPPPVY